MKQERKTLGHELSTEVCNLTFEGSTSQNLTLQVWGVFILKRVEPANCREWKFMVSFKKSL